MNAVDIGGVEGSVEGHCHNGVPRSTTNRLWASWAHPAAVTLMPSCISATYLCRPDQ
jgi:hypothetical protein